MRSLALALSLLALGLGAAPAVRAAAIWPESIPEPWSKLTAGGGDYTDVLGDEHPDPTDVVGGVIGTSSFTAGFYHVSPDNDQASFRMRVDESGLGTKSVWQFFLDTDPDPTTVDWVLEVRQSGPPSSRQVILVQATTGGPNFDDVELSGIPAWSGALGDWRRWVAVDDGSTFDEPPDDPGSDFFVDAALPLGVFIAATGLTLGDTFRVGLSTSTSHVAINKDVPLGLTPTDPVDLGFADPVVLAPEPGAPLLLALGGLALVARRRRGHAIQGRLGAPPRPTAPAAVVRRFE